MVEDIHDERERRTEAHPFELFGRTWKLAARVAWANMIAGALILATLALGIYLSLLVSLLLPPLTLVGIILSCAAAAFLLGRWSLLVPAIVIERKTTRAAFARSTELFLPFRWTVVAIVTLSSLLALALEMIVSEAFLYALPESEATFLADIVDGLLLTSTVVVVSTALYYDLLAADRRFAAASVSGPRDLQPWSADVTRLSR